VLHQPPGYAYSLCCYYKQHVLFSSQTVLNAHSLTSTYSQCIFVICWMLYTATRTTLSKYACLSVCLSVTLWHYVKTAEQIDEILYISVACLFYCSY